MLSILLLYLVYLSSFLRHCTADETPWQCQPGTADLNTIYPDLVRDATAGATIGEGTDGEIFLSNSSATTVSKRFFPEYASSDRIHHEYWVGHSLAHPNIAKTYSLSYERNTEENYWQMEMEFVPFSLLDLLDYDAWMERPWTFDAITCLFSRIVVAVAHMHEHGVAHRDLKVENVMIARDGTVKIIDFGSSAFSRNPLSGDGLKSWANWIGTPVTMAPEVHGQVFYNMERADVWSLAVIYIRLWLGVYPWEPELVVGGLAKTEAYLAFLEEVADGRPCDEHRNDQDDRLLCQIPQRARDVIAGMLEVDPERRISMQTVLGSYWLW